MTFQGKSILITGAASGIGRATAQHLAACGAARLILVDLKAVELGLSCPVDWAEGDVADEALWQRLASRLERLDCAVINAGVSAAAPIEALELAEWRRILGVNLDGAFLTLRAAMRAMADRGGAIVATASATGFKTVMGTAAYGTSKAGLIQLVKVAALEGAARKIRVNAVAPGGVETPIWDDLPGFGDRAAEIGREAAFAEMAQAATPLGRFATAEEVGRQIAFLLSDEAAMMTGSVLVCDGGYSA